MSELTDLLEFIKNRGRSLAGINPGSEEVALGCDDAYYALNILEKLQIPILGGDFLTEDQDSNLFYAYQSWGTKYHSLNWYCNQSEGENKESYVSRSCELARNQIEKALAVANELGRSCLVALVF